MKANKLLLVAAILLFSSAHAAEVYMWKDANGKKQFGSSPPPGVDFEAPKINKDKRTKEQLADHTKLQSDIRTENKAVDSAAAARRRKFKQEEADAAHDRLIETVLGFGLKK